MKTQLEIGKEYPPAGEDEIVAEMVADMKKQMKRIYPTPKSARQVHNKMHGCVKAEFIIEPNLKPELRIGVFKESKCFPAWVRFSNGKTQVLADKKADTRGIAIKLMGIPGEKLSHPCDGATQDFILASGPTFFTKNISDFRGLLKASISKYKLAAPLFLILRPLLLYRIMTKIFIKCKHPFAIPYYSTTPYRYGGESTAVKYYVCPSPQNVLQFTDEKDFDYLRKNMVATLNNSDIYFDFCIQFQTNANTMPIENTLVAWNSPYIKVATIRIPSQEFDTTEKNEFGDNLTYNIWHTIAEHRPLGSFNRCRRAIYESMYQFRQTENGIETQEPEAGPDFFNKLKPLKHV